MSDKPAGGGSRGDVPADAEHAADASSDRGTATPARDADARPFRRARSAQAKAARREALLASAAELVEAEGPEAVTLAEIARRAGVVKSAVYRYFESREEILMRLLAADLLALVEEIETRLAPLEGADDLPAAARAVARGFAARPRLCRLAAVMATALERNAGEATLISVKRDLLEAAGRLNAAGLAACPSVGEAGWRMTSRLTFSLVAGHWPFSNPAPHVARVMEMPEFAPIRKDFAEDLEQGLTALLRGLALSAPAPPPAPD